MSVLMIPFQGSAANVTTMASTTAKQASAIALTRFIRLFPSTRTPTHEARRRSAAELEL